MEFKIRLNLKNPKSYDQKYKNIGGIVKKRFRYAYGSLNTTVYYGRDSRLKIKYSEARFKERFCGQLSIKNWRKPI